MGIVHNIFAYLAKLSMTIIHALGYPGIVILMAMESMVIPLPSELVLPFAGFLAAQGLMNVWLILLFAVIGTLLGSLISYYVGYYGGNKMILKYGRFAFLDEEDLLKTEIWFKKRGEITIFFSRFIPVVRHIISIPAGIGKMNIKKFILYTVLGGAIWNGILIYAGYWLGSNWEAVRKNTEIFSWIVGGLLILAAIYFVYKHVKRKKVKRSKILELEKKLKEE